MVSPPVTEAVNFLPFLFQSGLGYSAICVARPTEQKSKPEILSRTYSILDYTPEIDLFAFRLNAQFERYAC